MIPERTRGLTILGVLLIILMAQPVYGSTQTVSGTAKIPVLITSGNSEYYLTYSYPSTATVGTNFTVAVTFGVTSFTGYKEYVQDFQVSVVIPFPDGKTLNVTNQQGYGQNATAVFLYPGSFWGPINFTFPLTPQNTGLKGSQSANANVTIGFADDVLYDNPVNYFYPEYGSATVGHVVVQNPAAAGLNWVPFALIGVGVVFWGVSLFMRRAPRSSS